MAEKTPHFKLILPDTGKDLYRPYITQRWGYRYGPSIMVHDGICEAWFASPGCLAEVDWFTYRKSADGGDTWTDEKVVLMPTPDSMDFFSVCDPAVIRYGGYYYIAYTSTVFVHGGGVCNNAYVARSRNAEGPYEKWTGSGWGEIRECEDGTVCRWTGKPAPVLYYDEPWQNWGLGEPSMVVKDDVLYFYYTFTSKRADGSPYLSTRVATADITDENWPAKLEKHGIAACKPSGACDSMDVVYCEDLKKFVALCTDLRFSDDSILAVWESDDGLRFTRVNNIKVNVGAKCHNCGISGDASHHIRKGDTMLLGYAYGDMWGRWPTRLHKYDFCGMDEEIYSETELSNAKIPVDLAPEPEKPWPIAITTDPHCYRLNIGGSEKINVHVIDNCYNDNEVEEGYTFSNYDSSIAEFCDGKVYAKKEGYTYVDVTLGDRTAQFIVKVYPAGIDLSEDNKKVTDFVPMQEEYVISTAENECKQIRGMAYFENGTWFEMCGENGVTYEITGDSVIKLDENGNVSAEGVGKASVKMTFGGITREVAVSAV